MNMMKRKSSLSLSLSLSRSRLPRTIITCTVVFLLCLAAGLLSGALFRTNQKQAEAASANITVANNNQVSTIDQGTTIIQRTSTVIVKDTTATLGYTLAARIENNSIPNSTVTVYSATSTTCTQASPCTITTDSTPTIILETTTTSATQTDGDTTDWTVTITLPGGTALGNYILDIAYAEDPILPPPAPQEPDPSTPTTYGAMQQMTNAECSTTRGTAFDARNGQTYYVQKIGNLCWMETNLRYAGDGDWYQNWSYPDDRYATTTANAANTQSVNDDVRPLSLHSAVRYSYIGGSQANAYTTAGYIDLYARGYGTRTLNIVTPGNNATFYGYLYNWCTAMGGQPNACSSTSTSGFDTTRSICPAGWRLPTGNTGGEFQTMANAIGATNNAVGSTNLRNNFLAVYSGAYYDDAYEQGYYGSYWSSTVNTNPNFTDPYEMYFEADFVPGASSNSRYAGLAVRCVLE